MDFIEARDSEWQWHQLGHTQVSISLQTDNHASTSPLSFYRPDALPAAQPTASSTEGISQSNNQNLFIEIKHRTKIITEQVTRQAARKFLTLIELAA